MKWQSEATVTKVIFSQKAQKQLIQHALFIYEQTQNPDIADAYLDKMQEYILSMLSHFPKSGRPSDDIVVNSRKLVYQGFSIIYRLNDTHIEILIIYKENLP
ncbi:MAG: type II toxin-antitoxin system RelE/ParE family toxin [Campylobacterota bacterium]|nr:type II toxin-antitoxin system RelE/ParE family toxin [Campylobacterota bacterium]